MHENDKNTLSELINKFNIDINEICNKAKIEPEIVNAIKEFMKEEDEERNTEIIEELSYEEVENSPLIDYVINGDVTELIYETGMCKVPTEVFHRSFGPIINGGYKAGLELQDVYYFKKKKVKNNDSNIF